MKIGLSFSRCILDIVEGRVDINDILVVVARTDFDPRDDDQWAGIWDGYVRGGLSNPEWSNYNFSDKEHEDKFRSVSIMLWEEGKFHQPRKFGARPRRLPHYWLEAGLLTQDIDSNPSVKKAWEQFQIIAGLANIKLDKEDR
jgi:hypothetical protein